MKSQSFYIYGRKPIEEQLLYNSENVLRVFISDRVGQGEEDINQIKSFAKTHRIPFTNVSHKTINQHVGDVNDQGIIALIKSAHYHDLNQWLNNLNAEQKHGVLILDHLEDTHNFGAILRTAAAVGVAGVIVAKDHQAPVNATVFKTSAGAATRIAVVRVSNINQAIKRLQEAKFWVAAVDMVESKKDFVWNHSFDTSMAFVLGGEGKGVAHRTKEICDFSVGLPMENNVESLNVSVAAACILYEWKRQQF